MNPIKSILLVLVIFSVAACSDDEDPTVISPTGLIYTYYPVNVGHTKIYDVELITKDGFSGASDTAIYQLKELVESTFTDNQGRPTQRLERYVRATQNDPWVISDVWTSNLTSTRVERMEENVPYVKLVFPMASGVNWNGNVLNTFDAQTYTFEDLHQPLSLGSMQFDSTITVLQRDEDYFTETFYEVEKFANHVGLIYKEHVFVEKDNSIPGQVGIKSQRKYKETLISYSN